MTTNRKATVATTTKKQVVMKETKVARVKMGDNREVRIVKIPTGSGVNLIRVGINMLPGGENMSGAVFSEVYLDEVIKALEAARA